MSGKIASRRKKDRRVKRTRDVLGDAIIELMQQRPFEEITVQQVLDRARVGRSTFYTHYSGKDDLLLSDIEDFFESVATHLDRSGDASHRVFPVRELFAHIADVPGIYRALLASGKFHDAMQLGEGCFARGIEHRLGASSKFKTLDPTSRKAIAQGLAGALLAILRWWVNHRMPIPPEKVDELFHRLT